MGSPRRSSKATTSTKASPPSFLSRSCSFPKTSGALVDASVITPGVGRVRVRELGAGTVFALGVLALVLGCVARASRVRRSARIREAGDTPLAARARGARHWTDGEVRHGETVAMWYGRTDWGGAQRRATFTKPRRAEPAEPGATCRPRRSCRNLFGSWAEPRRRKGAPAQRSGAGDGRARVGPSDTWAASDPRALARGIQAA